MERLTKVMDKYLKKAVADWDKKKVLTLTISKQWFDKIASGEKTEEYREIKPYWVARLLQNNSNIVDVRHLALALAGRTDLLKKYIDAQRIVLKQYTHVLFINGYRKDSQRIEKEIDRVSPSVSQRRECAPISGLIQSFSLLILSSV